MVMELLVADQPARETSHDPDLEVLGQGGAHGRDREPVPGGAALAPDPSHPAMRVNLDACIHCALCVRACREVQVNDVIGMAHRERRGQGRLRLRRPDGRVDLRRLRRVRAGLPDRRADAGGLSR